MAANDDIEVRDGFCNFYVSRVARVTNCYYCLHTLVIMVLVDADAIQYKNKFPDLCLQLGNLRLQGFYFVHEDHLVFLTNEIIFKK